MSSPSPGTLNEVDWSTLPAPTDDGACAHLTGTPLPSVELTATDGPAVALNKLPGRTVLYIYPMTGRPDVPLPDGWDGIPGARGCTPQSCAFRDHHAELLAMGVDQLFGLSTQDSAYQQEAAARLHLPFPLLSDAPGAFSGALSLPTFQVEGKTLIKRMALIIDDGVISQVFYPVFPPDQNAEAVMTWLRNEKQS